MTVEALKSSILTNNVNKLQECLANRNNIDLNHGFNEGSVSSILGWAVQQKNISVEIIRTLLAECDEEGQPAVDINQDSPIFYLFCNLSLNSHRRVEILDAILSLRDPHGRFIKDLTLEQGFSPLLKMAVLMDDAQCLEALLNVRGANGERVLDINEVKNGSTVLDLAYEKNSSLIKILENNGAKRAIALPLTQVTINDIKAAILMDSVERLQQCLAHRNNMDLNHGFNEGFVSSILGWAVQQKNISVEIIRTLLAECDEEGQPAVDINQDSPIFYLLCNLSLNSHRRVEILDAILSLRDPHGRFIKDLTLEQGFSPLLKMAVLMDDAQCLEALLNIRGANGERVLDINEVKNGSTVLDLAYEKNSSLIKILENNGAKRAIALPLTQVTINDIKAAILMDSLERLQQCLAHRNNIGLNHGFNEGFVSSILGWAVKQKNISVEIIQTLLAECDEERQPAVDVNKDSPIFYLLCNLSLNSHRRVEILDAILSLRDPHGRFIKDLTLEQGFSPLLKMAVLMDDAQCLEALLNVRGANGERVLDINEVKNGSTVLDLAYEKNIQLAEIIRLHGGVRATNISLQEYRAQYQRFLQRQALIIEFENRNRVNLTAKNALAEFAQYRQNTHNTEVTVSVNASVKRLLNRYPNISCDKEINEIEHFVTSITANDEYLDQLRKAISRIRQIKNTKAGVDVTLAEVLALVWVACSYQQGYGPDATPLSDSDIRDRKMTLMNNLVRCQNEYGINDPSCFVGTFNKIVESIDQLHPDVNLMTTKQAIMPVATTYSVKQVPELLSRKDFFKQREILYTWDDDDDKSAATLFRKECEIYVQNLLKEDYSLLITEKQRYEITDNFKWLSRPILHKALDELIEKIKSISNVEVINSDKNDDYQLELIKKIQERAEKVYFPSNQSLDAEYKELLFFYDNVFHYLQLSEKIFNCIEDKIAHGLSQKFFLLRLRETIQSAQHHDLDKWLKIIPFKNFQLENFNKLITTADALLAIEEEGTAERREAVKKISQIVRNAHEKFVEVFSIDDSDELFQFDLKNFLKLDFLIKHINLLKSSITPNDIFRQRFIQQLKEHANSFYINSQQNWLKGYKELKSLYDNFSYGDDYIANISSLYDTNRHFRLGQQIDRTYQCELGDLNISAKAISNWQDKAMILTAIDQALGNLKSNYSFFSQASVATTYQQLNQMISLVYEAENKSEIGKLLSLKDFSCAKKILEKYIIDEDSDSSAVNSTSFKM